ncbi:GntR family transcriptional regulator [Salipaludibacillus sp. CF4.18]|uniref:GntR family transcriptional regulator n=1 Tax=Salipaludibacillus sp. CF4.18 TaxID=3373081 RepID=UPI003EE6E2D7
MFSINTISTLSITGQVVNAIRTAIVTGEYEPGRKLSESNLSKFYGVSRTPIRESLKQLEREGLVEIIPRVGTCVSKPTETELTELFTVKESLEGLAAGQLAKNIDPKIIERLEKIVQDMDSAVENKENSLYVEANQNFHSTIVEGANNSKLTYLLNLLLNQLPYQQYVHLSIEVPNRLEKSLEEHHSILKAIKSGDSEKAEKVMRKHVKASGVQLKKGIGDKLLNKTKGE